MKQEAWYSKFLCMKCDLWPVPSCQENLFMTHVCSSYFSKTKVKPRGSNVRDGYTKAVRSIPNAVEFLQSRSWECGNCDTWTGEADLGGHVQKALQKYLYINHCSISWPLASCSIKFLIHEGSWSTDSNPSASPKETKRLQKHRRGPWCPRTSSWRSYSNGILHQLVVQPKYRSRNKRLLVRS